MREMVVQREGRLRITNLKWHPLILGNEGIQLPQVSQMISQKPSPCRRERFSVAIAPSGKIVVHGLGQAIERAVGGFNWFHQASTSTKKRVSPSNHQGRTISGVGTAVGGRTGRGCRGRSRGLLVMVVVQKPSGKAEDLWTYGIF